MLYDNQPAGRTILGTKQSLKKINSNILKKYKKDYYSPNNSFMIVGEKL